MKREKIAVILVNWNGARDTINCLETLDNLKKTEFDTSIIVVDNASSDSSVVSIREKYPKAVLIENSKNLGFTGGNNIAIEYALKNMNDYVWLLNNDTIVDQNALIELHKCAQESRVGIVGTKIYFMKGSEFHKSRYKSEDLGKVLWYAGGIIDWANMYGSHRGVDEVDSGQYDAKIETDFATGCSMFIKEEVFHRIGLFDERYFMYYEDLDFCLRAKTAGYKVKYEPFAKVWHKNASTSGGAGSKFHEYYQTRNRILCGMRYAPLRTKIALLREMCGMVFSNQKLKKQAVLDYLRGRFGNMYDKK